MNASLDPALSEAIARTDLATLDRRRGFDAIVVGAGAAGGMAALQLTGAGLDVLVLDAGWPADVFEAPLRTTIAALVRGIADPRLQTRLPPGLVAAGTRALRLLGRIHQPIQARCFAWPLAPGAFVCDRDRPYSVERGAPFHWFRTEQLGGRMIVPGHGRQYWRMGPRDLRPTDGLSPAWPLEPDELARWYAYVEDLLGVRGGPGEEVPPERQIHPNPAERQALELIRRRWPALKPTIGRSAPPLDALGLAAASGRLHCRRGAVAAEVLVDAGGAAHGVSFVDRESRSMRAARAPLVFLCASTLESTRILLASEPPKGPIGARSRALGRFLMDHVILSGEGVAGPLPSEPVENLPGRCLHLPRLDLREVGRDGGRGASDSRGHSAQLYRWSIGEGRSYFNCVSLAEMLPDPQNRARLDRENTDAFGLPTLQIRCRHGEAERRRGEDQAKVVRELGELFGVEFTRLLSAPAVPGAAIHECGAARMGDDPGTSVLDPHNQCWDVRGLYVTDGAAFPSQGGPNPTLTILALTARACAHASGVRPAEAATRAAPRGEDRKSRRDTAE
jgi:choline dehydrogenase-like flavoprotein